MNQPVPKVEENDVLRIVKRDFLSSQFEIVMEILNEYGNDAGRLNVHRVRLAVLKLAAGDLEVLRNVTEIANRDYRDVIVNAEYPRYMNEVFSYSDLSKRQVQEIILEDWSEYEDWMNKKVK